MITAPDSVAGSSSVSSCWQMAMPLSSSPWIAAVTNTVGPFPVPLTTAMGSVVRSPV